MKFLYRWFVFGSWIMFRCVLGEAFDERGWKHVRDEIEEDLECWRREVIA